MNAIPPLSLGFIPFPRFEAFYTGQQIYVKVMLGLQFTGEGICRVKVSLNPGSSQGRFTHRDLCAQQSSGLDLRSPQTYLQS